MPIKIKRKNGKITRYKNAEYIPLFYFFPKFLLDHCRTLPFQISRYPYELFTDWKQIELIESDQFALLMYDALTENNLSSDSVVSAYAKTSAYLSSVKATDISEAGLQATLYKQMISHLSDDYSDVYSTVEALEKAQNGNGSFYDSIYDTYLVIKYLNSLNTINDIYKVESFDVALDNNTFTVNEEGQVNGQYTIDYQTAVTKSLTIVSKLYDGEKELASAETPVTLDRGKTQAKGSAFSFDINEKEIKTLKITSSLCDGTKELYGCTGYLYVQEKPVVPDTQVTDAGITLSDNYGFVNEKKRSYIGNIYSLFLKC